MSVIRAKTVRADFTNPSKVLGALNDAFPMDQQNGMYFTIWYGVYDITTKTVRYAGGGHHPAVLIAPSAEPQLLKGRGVPIGCFARVEYQGFTVNIPDGAQLYVFSDGLFEIELKAREDMLTFDAFVDIIVGWRQTRPDRELINVLEAIQDIQGKPNFDDDCSLLELSFRPAGQVRLVA
jgi:sigma-B regulation protein RsbU (phosphoserine phosphatase)